MTTLTFDIPQKSVNKYEEIFNYFIVNYDIKELEKIKEDVEFSKKLYVDYNNDVDGKNDVGVINTNGKNKNEILSELNNTLWN